MSIVHLEVVCGKKVRDSAGKVVGRLEAVHGDWRGGEFIITHYVLARPGTYLLRQFGIARKRGVIVPWNKLDLEKLRLLE